MKKENLTKLIVLTSVIVLCAGIVAFASSLTTEIKAILTQEFTIKYYGEVQEMKDGSGNPVYPIVYNGTTYLPVRAISDMMGIPVDWDASTKTVILGTEEKPPKSVLSFEGKTSDYSSKVTDKASLTVKGANGADIVYNDGVSFRIWNGTSSAN
ncbi:stalk domain-containing protein, partial [Acetivibrio saccincola]